MGVLNGSSSSSTPTHSITGPKPSKHHPQKTTNPQRSPAPSSSWEHFKSLVSCKETGHHRASKKPNTPIGLSSCGSLCSFRDVVHCNTRVVHRADTSPESTSMGPDTRFLTRKPGQGSSSSRSLASSTVSSFSTVTWSSSSRGMQLRRLSGCYECRMIVDPSRYPITPRGTVCACSQCGEIFPKIESLEHHQAIRHAVSDLGPEDSGRNIVEIIFKSSWMNKLNPMFKIERILKVHNTPRTIQRFEECRETVKERSINVNAKKNERCAADGNELMRFHCTVIACSLGADDSSTLCGSVPSCGVCTIIRHGFQGSKGVRTTASSGRAHQLLNNYSVDDDRRAMLVCRVIAGRIRRGPPNNPEDEPPVYDSVATSTGVFSNLEELVVFNPRAILPCFVVIYNAQL